MNTPTWKRPLGVSIAGRRLGPGNPCFVIAEAGVNHGGDPGLAHRLVDAAAAALADAVKFQTFEPSLLAAEDASRARYQEEPEGGLRTQREMLSGLTLSKDAHYELKRHAEDLGLVFLSSPFDETSADFLDQLGVPAFKTGSGELTNHPLLAHLARKGRAMLVSTGMSDMRDVARALEVVRRNGDPELALLHCVSCYPAAAEDANLKAMDALDQAFGVPVGWSDHTQGIDVALAAVARGACVLEKHLTLDRGLPGPDHCASLEPRELHQLVRSVRRVEAALGSGVKEPRPSERPIAQVARKSLHWRVRLEAGMIVELQHLIALRPGTGIPPSEIESILGRIVNAPTTPGTQVRAEQLEGASANRSP